jgi:S-formylglutathione hydrolase
VDRYFDTQEAARQQTAPLHLHPLDWPKKQWIASHPHDPWHEGSERLLSKIDSMGIPCDRIIDASAANPNEFLRRQIRPALEFVTQALRSLKA